MEINYLVVLSHLLEGFTHGTGFILAVLLWYLIFNKKEPKEK